MTEEYEVEVWTENENMIEFLDNDKEATVTLHDMRLKNRVLKLAEEYPDEVTISQPGAQGMGCYLPSRKLWSGKRVARNHGNNRPALWGLSRGLVDCGRCNRGD